ncbi:uncharacterized protein LOC131891930 isoform X1 [Tigriopus californicus]|uniref:uncharacterized protein LOC131891930 isoform X1 n=1 Tax=Tigriopus californicus TaxID=6832 RepID=UPI0027DA05AE|nr:uncharacterized protein LOC131891930 isoform X1 [Tigriopus californicus]XP_059097605.1 uncharacterized protein LOC131891930 isoform X1 [Tigriopus californicus]XP_059097606.1 uncharacterized protein LOC131891930 isoform X1 [Tigriopus californicus]
MKQCLRFQSNIDYEALANKARYLRDHILLAIAKDMIEVAQSIIDCLDQTFCESDKIRQIKNMRTIVYALYGDGTTRLERNHHTMTPLVMTIKRNLPSLTEALTEIEWKYLMTEPINSTISPARVRAHHATEIAEPQHVELCLGSRKPSDEILEYYFEFQMRSSPLNRKIEKLSCSQTNQIWFLKQHRQWAVQVLNHSILHQVTNALATLDINKQKQVVCMASSDNLLQLAVTSGKRLIIGELLHQEYLCHKTDKLEGTLCLKNQLVHDNDVIYTIDTFSSFYPQTVESIFFQFVLFYVIPCLLETLLICVDIWKDMDLTKELNRRRNDDSVQEIGTDFELAFEISVTSQFLTLFVSIPICIWKLKELWKKRFRDSENSDANGPTSGGVRQSFINKTGSSTSVTRPNIIEMSQIPNEETESSTSGIPETRQTRGVQKGVAIILKTVPHICPILSLLLAPLTFVICIFGGTSLTLSFTWTSNIFSASIIFGLAVARVITKGQLVFATNTLEQFDDLNKQLHHLHKQFVLTIIGESCLEATVQLGLQIWLLSQENCASELRRGFIWSAIQIVASLIDADSGVSSFQIQLVLKLFLSCLSIVITVGGSYRHLKKQSMTIKHLAFIFLALHFQLWARMSVIFAWCQQEDYSANWKIAGVAMFFMANSLIVAILKFIFRTKRTNHDKPTAGWENRVTTILGVVASSLLLVRIPKVKNNKEIMSKEGFDMHFYYFLTSLCFNVFCVFLLWWWQSNQDSLITTLVEICVLSLAGLVCQICYYTVYGHPWRTTVRQSFFGKQNKTVEK